MGGVINRHGRRAAPEGWLSSMEQAIRHRGPNGSAFVSPDVARQFFNVRLAIVDIAGGDQPLYNEDGSLGVVFNGEIYNHAELRDELTARGHVFKTKTDGEVIVHLFEAEGTAGFARLEGMFAFCLWNGEQTWLVRDKIGIKPLYVYEDGERLAFCSEVRGLQATGLPMSIDADGVRDYLVYRYIRAPLTLFKQVRKVPPGHMVVIRGSSIRTEAYWELPTFVPTPIGVDEAVEQLEQMLRRSIRGQLMGEVPIGVLLSGGIDSSTVAWFLNDEGVRLKAFSIGFESVNEFEYSRQIAKAYGLDYRELVLSKSEFIPYLERDIAAIDEPIADPACIPLYKLAEEIRRHVTVVLSGEGADEMMGGYWQYDRVLTSGVSRDATGLDRFLRESSYFTDNPRLMLGPQDERGDRFLPYFSGAPDLLSSMLAYDQKTWLPDNLMMKADKILMAQSLEGRFPFLDSRLMSWLTTVPSALKLTPEKKTKFLLRKLMNGKLPDGVMNRPKMGFTVPIREVLLDARGLAQDVINSFSPLDDCLDHLAVVRLFNDWFEGRNTEDLKVLYGGFRQMSTESFQSELPSLGKPLLSQSVDDSRHSRRAQRDSASKPSR
ncbi:MAG: asparagine synthase (glutamine-hydrolyzing) [Archangiaceae bacterium]|nr:asparagine synthase (glutamine-hydrolyzing) [Archangiaceae bacterium]